MKSKKILVEFMTGQQYTECNWRPCRNAKVFKETDTVNDILDFLSQDKDLKSADLVILEETK